MKAKQLFFFAIEKDLIELVKFIEQNYDIQYAEAGLMDERVTCIPFLISVVQSINIEYPDWNFNEAYLVLPKNSDLYIREVPQRKGGIKFAVNQMMN